MIDESLYGRLSLITVPRDVTAKDDDKLHKRQFPIASTTVTTTEFLTRTILDPNVSAASAGFSQSLMRAPQVSGPALNSPSNGAIGLLPSTPSFPVSTNPTMSSNLKPAAVASAETPASTEPSIMAPKANTSPLSESTQHLLIAAGCVGATIVVAFIIYMIYRWRKGDKPATVFRLSRRPTPQTKPAREPFVSAPLGGDWNDPSYKTLPWETKSWDVNSSSRSLLYQPPAALVRPDTASSSSRSVQAPSQSPFPPPNPFPNPSPLGQRNILNIDPFDRAALGVTPPRRASVTAGSPLLPIEVPIKMASDKRRSSNPAVSPYSPVSPKTKTSPLAKEASRFSWTNSQAPKTPVETSRFSVATSRRSSIPRFRTVESWVGQQANQLEERSFQEYLEREIEDKILQSAPPKVPRKGGPPPSKGMGTSRLVTQSSDSPFFRQHPGTEVRLPRASLIPSEILDDKLGPRDTRELIRGSFERRGSEL